MACKHLFQLALFVAVLSMTSPGIYAQEFPASDTCKIVSNHSPMTRLKQNILCDYDNTLIPTSDKRKDVPQIELALWLRQLEFDDMGGKFRISHWLTMKWEDQHLSWEPAVYDNIEKIQVTTNEIWVPNLELYSPSDMSYALITPPGDTNCALNHTGVVQCVVPGEFTGICISDYTQFPYDIHNCGIEFGSLIYKDSTTDNLVFTNFTIKELMYTRNNEWKLLETYGGIDQMPTMGKKLVGKKTNATYYQQMYIDIKFQRHSAMWEVTLIVPMIVLMIFALISLTINPILMERIFLLVVNIACHISVFYLVPWIIPPSGDFTPAIVLFYRDSLIIISVLLIQSWLANWMEENNQVPPDWILSLNSKIMQNEELTRSLVTKVSTNGVAETKLSSTEDHLEEEGETPEEHEKKLEVKPTNDWKLFRKYFDYFTILCIFLAYCFVFIKNDPYFEKMDEKTINRTHHM